MTIITVARTPAASCVRRAASASRRPYDMSVCCTRQSASSSRCVHAGAGEAW